MKLELPDGLPTVVRPDRSSAAVSPWAVFWLASVAAFLVGIDTTVLFAAFKAMHGSFPTTSAADLSWVVNAYTVVYAGMLVPAGRLSDAHGRKRTFLFGLALFVLASAGCGLAGTAGLLIGARVLQAFGAALLTPASLSIVLAAFPQTRRAVTVSLWGAVGGLAAAVGPSLGSFVVDAAGWPWAFYLNVPLGAASLWLGSTLLPKDDETIVRREIDFAGALLLMAAVVAITLGIVQSDSGRWSRSELSVAVGTGLLLLLAFVGRSSAVRTPLVDLDLFKDPTYVFANLASLAFGAAFSMMFFGYFLFLTGVWHYSLTRAGLAVTPGPLLVIPVAIITGRLAARVGHRPFLVGGSLLHAGGSLWFVLAAGPSPAYLSQWLPGVVMSGIGVGMVLPSLSAAAVNRLPSGQYAVGSAVNQAIRQIGSVLGVAIVVLLVGHPAPTRGDFDRSFLLQIVLALLTALLCMKVRTKPTG